MNHVSQSALLYALRELSRRAGVTFDFFNRWRITFRGGLLIVQPQPDSSAEIGFPIFSPSDWQDVQVVRKAWASDIAGTTPKYLPDLIVPFCRNWSIPGEPLFVQANPRVFRCTEDLLSSLLLTMCRREEVGSTVLDSHGRFPAAASIATRGNFLGRPIVDEYGLAFQEILQILMPEWQPIRPAIRVKISHDIDELGIPFSLKSATGHLLLRGAPVACARDFLGLASRVEPGYLHAVRRICRLSSERGLRSVLYWKAAGRSVYDTGYDVNDAKIARVMEWAREQGIEMGVHPGYETFRSQESLKDEVNRCRVVLRKDKLGGRQDFLRWCPETWGDWEASGLAYDCSVGFADHAGFRCGTCFPFLPWLWELDRPANLLEIPLIAMDSTLVLYMKLNPEQSLKMATELFDRCKIVGGVFTLLWHNSSLFPPFAEHYLPILNMLIGAKDYDWESDYNQLRQECHQLSHRKLDAHS